MKKHHAIAEHHQTILIDLKIQRNRLAPISRLPPDVLYKIFFISSRDIDLEGIKWTRLTQVCHEWRALALNSPSLWSNPPLHNYYAAKEMLIRSEGAPLTVETGYGACLWLYNSYIREILETQMHRINCVKVAFQDYDGRRLLSYFPESAPNLKSLTLCCFDYYSPNFAVPILQHNSLCNMDHLQKMNLDGIGINWESHLPSSLTSLKISHIHQSTLPTMTQVWQALQKMPLLETLELIDALPTSAQPIRRGKVIGLDRLQNLKLDTGIAEVESFLQTVVFPPSISITIICHQVNPTAYADLNEIVAFLRRYCKASYKESAPLFESLQIFTPRCSRALQVCVPGATAEDKLPCVIAGAIEIVRSPIQPFFLFEVEWDSSPVTIQKLLIDIFGQLLFFGVTKHLEFTDHTDRLSTQTLLLTIGLLPAVQTIEVCLRPPILDALKSRLALSGEVTPGMTFPRLEQITIVGTIFYDTEALWGGICIDDLLDWLAWRREHAAAIQKLTLKSCSRLNEEKVVRLKGVVPEVEWDGLELNDGLESELKYWHGI